MQYLGCIFERNFKNKLFGIILRDRNITFINFRYSLCKTPIRVQFMAPQFKKKKRTTSLQRK